MKQQSYRIQNAETPLHHERMPALIANVYRVRDSGTEVLEVS